VGLGDSGIFISPVHYARGTLVTYIKETMIADNEAAREAGRTVYTFLLFYSHSNVLWDSRDLALPVVHTQVLTQSDHREF